MVWLDFGQTRNTRNSWCLFVWGRLKQTYNPFWPLTSIKSAFIRQKTPRLGEHMYTLKAVFCAPGMEEHMCKFLNVHTFINFHIFGKHLISSPNIRENTSRHGGLWYCVLVTTRHQTYVDSKYLVTTQTSNAMWLEHIVTTHTRKT